MMIGRIGTATNTWLPVLASILVLLPVLAGCEGSGGSAPPAKPEPIGDNCGPTSALENGTCRTFAIRMDERAPTPFIENGQSVTLEVVLFRPLDEGRYPTIVFHHGSTGNGSDPSRFGLTFTHEATTRYFVENGWMVVFPQRRGRGQSGGLYDEGFKLDRSSYSCQNDLALAGASRALDDLNVITDWVRSRADVDTTRMLVGGTSRGGILAVAHVAQRPDVYLGAINFVGGWISEGCGDYRSINRSLFVDGAMFPGSSLWLYGSNDSFYSLAYSRTNFDSFSMAGGLGTMIELTRAQGLNGHFVINDLELWEHDMDEFI
ncbi:MAG: alpha/beta hydrolase family protein, partial [Woeseiaceae bacterium]